jgi:hypothetical protein
VPAHRTFRGHPYDPHFVAPGHAPGLDCPVYVIDDDSAVRVRGDEIDVVSDGKWLLLNAPAPQTAVPGDQKASRPRGSRRLPALRPTRRSRG